MNRILNRIVILLLLPSMIVDPAFAKATVDKPAVAQATRDMGQATSATLSSRASSRASVFEEQALSLTGLSGLLRGIIKPREGFTRLQELGYFYRQGREIQVQDSSEVSGTSGVAGALKIGTEPDSSGWRERIEQAVRPIANEYNRTEWARRKALTGLPTPDELYEDQIEPELVRRYTTYLDGQVPANLPAAVLHISGDGGSGKSSIAPVYVQRANQALRRLAARMGYPVKSPVVLDLYDDYLVPRDQRDMDPRTGEPSVNPLKKFAHTRYVRNRRAAERGEDFFHLICGGSGKRLEIRYNRAGHVEIIGGGERVIVPPLPTLPKSEETRLIMEVDSIPVTMWLHEEPATYTEQGMVQRTVSNAISELVLTIRDTDHIVTVSWEGGTTDAEANLQVKVGGHEVVTLKPGQSMRALNHIAPAGKVLVFEGLLTLADEAGMPAQDLDPTRDLTVWFDADFEARRIRMAPRAPLRGLSEWDFMNRREFLRLNEELPYVEPTRKRARWVANTLNLAEAIYVLYRQGALHDPSPQINKVFEELGINLEDIVAALRGYYVSAIKERLSLRKLNEDLGGTAFIVFFDDGGLVIKAPHPSFQVEFEDKFINFYNKVLKKRLGGLMVPGAIERMDDLHIPAIVGNRYGKLRHVLVQNRVDPLSKRLMTLAKEGQIEKAQALIDSFFVLQRGLWRLGIVDTDANMMEQYGVMVLDGLERVVVFGLDGLTTDRQQYKPEVFRGLGRRFKNRGLLPEALVAYYMEKAIEMETKPDVALKDTEFGRDIEHAKAVPDLSDYEIGKKQMAYLDERITDAKLREVRIIFDHFLTTRPPNDSIPPFLYWLKLYQETLYGPGDEEYQILQRLHDQLMAWPANDLIALCSEGALMRQGRETIERLLDAAVILDKPLSGPDLYHLKEGLRFFSVMVEKERPIPDVPRLWKKLLLPGLLQERMARSLLWTLVTALAVIALVELPLTPMLGLWLTPLFDSLSRELFIWASSIGFGSLLATLIHGFPIIKRSPTSYRRLAERYPDARLIRILGWVGKTYQRQVERYPQTLKQFGYRFLGAVVITALGFLPVFSEYAGTVLAHLEPLTRYIFPYWLASWLAPYMPALVPAYFGHMAYNYTMYRLGHPEFWLSLWTLKSAPPRRAPFKGQREAA